MSNDKQHYDLIIIGTGAGGGTLACKLAPTGKNILILEQGTFLPREKANWSASEVYVKERYLKQVAICLCKATGNAPFFNGTYKNL